MEHLGSKLGCKNVPRVRKSVEKMILELGISARKALRMDPHVFYQLHDVLEADVAAKFSSRKRLAGDTTEGGSTRSPNGLVSTKLRLSCAMRHFAGAAVHDLILTHGGRGDGGLGGKQQCFVGHDEEAADVRSFSVRAEAEHTLHRSDRFKLVD